VGIFNNDPYKRPDPHGVKTDWANVIACVCLVALIGILAWGIESYKHFRQERAQKNQELAEKIIERIIDGVIPVPIEEEPK
jgi:hypothetical protein